MQDTYAVPQPGDLNAEKEEDEGIQQNLKNSEKCNKNMIIYVSLLNIPINYSFKY